MMMHVYFVRMIGEQGVSQCYLEAYWSLSWQIREVHNLPQLHKVIISY